MEYTVFSLWVRITLCLRFELLRGILLWLDSTQNTEERKKKAIWTQSHGTTKFVVKEKPREKIGAAIALWWICFPTLWRFSSLHWALQRESQYIESGQRYWVEASSWCERSRSISTEDLQLEVCLHRIIHWLFGFLYECSTFVLDVQEKVFS